MSEDYKRQVTKGIFFGVAIIAARYHEYWYDDFSSIFPWFILAMLVYIAAGLIWVFRKVRKNQSDENNS